MKFLIRKVMSHMSADLEMVKTYIKYLRSFCPTPEEREFLEKHKKDILGNDYYHALVNESIRKNNYNEEYYKKKEQFKGIEIVESLTEMIGSFVIDGLKSIKDIKNNMDASLQLNQLSLCGSRGSNDTDDHTIYLEYYPEMNALNILSLEEHHFIVEVNDKEVVAEYIDFDTQTNMYSYMVENIHENDQVTIYIKSN